MKIIIIVLFLLLFFPAGKGLRPVLEKKNTNYDISILTCKSKERSTFVRHSLLLDGQRYLVFVYILFLTSKSKYSSSNANVYVTKCVCNTLII